MSRRLDALLGCVWGPALLRLCGTDPDAVLLMAEVGPDVAVLGRSAIVPYP